MSCEQTSPPPEAPLTEGVMLTADDVAAMLACSTRTVYRLADSGRMPPPCRLGRLARAHYNFGIYFKRLGERDKALFHFQKAQSESGSDPVLRSRIQEGMKGLQ